MSQLISRLFFSTFGQRVSPQLPKQIDHVDLVDLFSPAAELNYGILMCAYISLLLTDHQPKATTDAVDYPRAKWMEHLRLSPENYISICHEMEQKHFLSGLAFDL